MRWDGIRIAWAGVCRFRAQGKSSCSFNILRVWDAGRAKALMRLYICNEVDMKNNVAARRTITNTTPSIFPLVFAIRKLSCYPSIS